MFNLNHKIAVITGGGSGIGQSIACLFARQGAHIHILELSESAGSTTQNLILANNGQCTVHTSDVSNQTAILSVFDKIGPLDILVNNAGIAHIGNVENTTEDDFDRVIHVNVKGTYHCLKAAIPKMKERGGGAIINMASIAALVGIPDRFAYSMSKGAVIGMTLSTAKDYLKYNIRCNSISPARIYTPFVEGFLSKNYPDNKAEMFEKLAHSQPIGRMGTPEEVAHLALFLCSDEASFITGCDYPIDGGFIKLNN